MIRYTSGNWTFSAENPETTITPFRGGTERSNWDLSAERANFHETVFTVGNGRIGTRGQSRTVSFVDQPEADRFVRLLGDIVRESTFPEEELERAKAKLALVLVVALVQRYLTRERR